MYLLCLMNFPWQNKKETHVLVFFLKVTRAVTALARIRDANRRLNKLVAFAAFCQRHVKFFDILCFARGNQENGSQILSLNKDSLSLSPAKAESIIARVHCHTARHKTHSQTWQRPGKCGMGPRRLYMYSQAWI